MVKDSSVFVIIPSVSNILKEHRKNVKICWKSFQIHICVHSCPQWQFKLFYSYCHYYCYHKNFLFIDEQFFGKHIIVQAVNVCGGTI